MSVRVRTRALLAVVALLVLGCAEGFYLPGVAPAEYIAGESIDLSVNKLTSVHTQLPLRYYDLPFCRPVGLDKDGNPTDTENIEDARENLGEILLGDVIENSPYKVEYHSSLHYSLLDFVLFYFIFIFKSFFLVLPPLSHIETGFLQLEAKVARECRRVCNAKAYNKEQLDDFAEKIEQEYRIHW